jgi:hypothetical protein
MVWVENLIKQPGMQYIDLHGWRAVTTSLGQDVFKGPGFHDFTPSMLPGRHSGVGASPILQLFAFSHTVHMTRALPGARRMSGNLVGDQQKKECKNEWCHCTAASRKGKEGKRMKKTGRQVACFYAALGWIAYSRYPLRVATPGL